MQGYKLQLKDMDGKWERVEEEDNPLLVSSVPWLKRYLEALKCLTEGEVPPRRQLISMRKSVAYLVGDSSGLGFILVTWSQSRLV